MTKELTTFDDDGLDYEDMIHEEQKMRFTIYSKDGCSYCTKAVKLLELAKVDFVVYKLDRDFKKEEFISEFGHGSPFPRITVNGKLIGGCMETFRYLEEKKLV